MTKIWLRISDLTHGRNIFGVPIGYDGLLKGMLEIPEIDVYADFPLGVNERQPPPDDSRISIIYGDFTKYDERDIEGSIIYTPIHSVDLPQEWIEKINKSKAFITASYGVSKYHQESGKITVPIYTWLPGIADSFHYYKLRNFNSTPFIFLQVSVIQWRKGSDLTCEAFTKAFTDKENVMLIFQTPGETDMLKDLQTRYGGDYRILFDVCALDNDKMQELYQIGHCFVYPSMDGPGLTLLEAMRTGLPSLVTDIYNMTDVFNQDFGWLIDKETIVDSLAEKMMYAYTNRNICEEKGLLASQYSSQFTWKRCAESALLTIKEMNDKT